MFGVAGTSDVPFGVIHGFLTADYLANCNWAYGGSYEGGTYTDPQCATSLTYEDINSVASTLGVRIL